jgi:iron complex outermembrane receptor protein
LHTSQVVSLESHGDYYSKWGATGIGGSLSKVGLNSNNLGNRSRQICTFFLEHRAYFLNKKLDITPGVALSHYSNFGSHFFPGIDVGYTLKSGIKLFTNMGYTWRIPTYTDLYYVGTANIGNENLVPESALSYEVGAKYTHSHWHTNISWFSRKSSNLIDWIKDSKASDTSKWQPQNLNDLTIRGLDFNINLSGQALLGSNEILENIQIGYTYIDAEIPQYSNIISRYVLENLNHQLTVNIQHRIVGQLHHNLRLRYLDRASMANYFVIDTKLFWEAEKYSFYLTINNLFNESYYESNLVEMPDLWLFAGIKLKIPY